jgi:Fe-S-cluster containining protein
MEFDLDEKLVNGIIADEMRQTRADLGSAGPMVALERSQSRHEARLATAADAPTLACKAGCFWCCYFSVDVRPVEVLRILEYLQTELATLDRERITAEIMTNGAALAALDDDARVRSNTKCPFLHLGRCSIYSVRPQTCRNYHATNAAGCQKAYEEPDNDDIDPEFAPLVYQSGHAHVDAFSEVLREAGYDVDAYELNTAMAAALADPAGTKQRFEARQRTFTSIEGSDVPSEFIDS